MQNGIRILIVDDEDSLRRVLSQVLTEDGHRVTVAASGEEALDAFKEETYPLVITDIKMPGMSGLDLLKEIKEINLDTQVVIMTSHASLDTAIRAIHLGAYDYLIKPFDDIDLISMVSNRALEKTNLIAENKALVKKLSKKNKALEKANDVLKEMAIRDGLTGLYNHRYFQELLAIELLRSRRHSHVFSLIFIDVDNFKQYNDTHGHLEGDKLLHTLAKIVGERLRGPDIFARYGGEEFVIILPETPKEEAMQVAEGIRSQVADYPFLERETQPTGQVTVSLGVASYPEDGKDGSSLIGHADKSLYKAKKNGRNRIC